MLNGSASQEAYMDLHHSQLSARPINHVNKSYQPPQCASAIPTNLSMSKLCKPEEDLEGSKLTLIMFLSWVLSIKSVSGDDLISFNNQNLEQSNC